MVVFTLNDSLYFTETGELYMWGKNRYAVLGLGHEKDQFFPFKVSACCARMKIVVTFADNHFILGSDGGDSEKDCLRT